MNFDRVTEAQFDPVARRGVAEPIGVVDVVYDVLAAVKKVGHAIENVVESSVGVHTAGVDDGVAKFAEVDQPLRAAGGGEGKPSGENDDGDRAAQTSLPILLTRRGLAQCRLFFAASGFFQCQVGSCESPSAAPVRGAALSRPDHASGDSQSHTNLAAFSRQLLRCRWFWASATK